MQYRGARVSGGTSIFTVNLAERHRSLLVDSIEILRKVVATVKERHPFTIDKEDLEFESKSVSTSLTGD